MHENLAWFALSVKPQHERSTFNALTSKGLEALLPLYRARRYWSDRIKQLDSPLFPGYVFCRFAFDRRLAVLTTPGVTSVVGFGKTPSPVSDDEIAGILAVIAAGCPVEPWPFLRVGQRVRIEHGALAGLEGILAQAKDSWRVVLNVELLQRSIAVEINRAYVSPVNDSVGVGIGTQPLLALYDCYQA
jgi:transcription antitermination factor NusG